VLRERFPLHGLATVVDAGEGVHALDEPESRARVAAADLLVLSKIDFVGEVEAERLAAALSRINPHAEVVRAEGEARDAWAAAASSPGRELRRIEAALDAGDAHDAGIRAHTVRFDAPLELSGFCMRLASFLHANADRVLRVKGLVAIRGRHGPAVIQAVGPSLQPVRTLKEWPAGSAPGALVVIGRGLDAESLAAALAEQRS
jgi:G3E family GTPase